MRQKYSTGFTVSEVLIVIVVIGILATLLVSVFPDSQAKARDAERTTDIDNLHSKLEDYYSNNGGYPNTLSTSLFPGLDLLSLKDPSGNSIAIATVTDQAAALASTNPTAAGANYHYLAYPAGCSAITCTGYVLKSYIEKPTPATPDPYIKTGLSNN